MYDLIYSRGLCMVLSTTYSHALLKLQYRFMCDATQCGSICELIYNRNIRMML